MSLHPHNIAQKTEVMVEHFRALHAAQDRRQGQGDGGHRSPLHAVRYKQAFDKYIAEKGYTDIKTLVAFSGTVDRPGRARRGVHRSRHEQRHPGEGAAGASSTRDEYQVLLVAEKYQTGFDQPLLHTMYVDKRLAGVQAVQTLSRLNRTHPGKEDTFVLDFVNEPEEILEAFQPYYEQTIVGEQAEPQQLYELQAKLDAQQVYYKAEVEEFCKVFFKPKANQTPADHAKMNACIDPAVNRFNGSLRKRSRRSSARLLVAYRNLYAFLSQIIPFQDSDLEKLYSYVRFLLTKLPQARTGARSTTSTTRWRSSIYRLQKISEGAIDAGAGRGGARYRARRRSAPAWPRTRRSSCPQLIDILNERFGTDFKPADQLFFDSIREDAVADAGLRQAAHGQHAWRTSATSSARRWRGSSSTAWSRTRRSPPSS